MKPKLVRLVALLLFVAGVLTLSYPTISNWLFEYNQVRKTQTYIRGVANLTQEQIQEEWKKARWYNDTVAAGVPTDPFSNVDETVPFDKYDETLNINGMMGSLEIPDLHLYIPIYHGVSDVVLKKGVGHIKATALPIGGKGSHTVLTGHSGLPSAKLFTDLGKLEKGDYFIIHVLDEDHAYKIDEISIIDPGDISKLRPIEGEDYVTLVTCTPIGINDHRLLVRGKRCEMQDGIADSGKLILLTPFLFAGFVIIGAMLYGKIRKKK
ncbi:MAG: class C sortase [Lachnospiraceae bacterium]|nr:class C sortase [Lachnospiraceae bacterium]